MNGNSSVFKSMSSTASKSYMAELMQSNCNGKHSISWVARFVISLLGFLFNVTIIVFFPLFFTMQFCELFSCFDFFLFKSLYILEVSLAVLCNIYSFFSVILGPEGNIFLTCYTMTTHIDSTQRTTKQKIFSWGLRGKMEAIP